MRALPTLLLLALATSTARAGNVGVVVTGDPTMQPQLAAQVESWLRQHGHELVPSPLPPDAVNTLIDCFVIEDSSCARGLVERRAKTATLLFARVDVTDNAASGMRDVMVTAYWFDKGHDPVAERRTCEHCTDEMLRTTTDALMSALAGAQSDQGRLTVTATPVGAAVLVDGKPAGTAPVDLPLPPGPHRITCRHPGHRDVERTVTVTSGETTPVTVELSEAAPARSRMPYLVIGGGGALVLTGIVLYATSETDTGEKFEYRDTRPLGLGVGVVGLAVAGVGAYLLLRHTPADSQPTVAVVPGGATVGWAGAF